MSFPVRLAASVSTVAETATWCVDPARTAGVVESRWSGSAISLLEWTLPVVAYVQITLWQKRYAVYSAALLCDAILKREPAA